jgi:hypothetical protein
MDIVVGRRIIKKLLHKHNYKKRKIQKRLSTGEVCSRNEQFENIAKLKKEYIKNKNLVISCDTKKKEFIGDLHRVGATYSKTEQVSYDSDSRSSPNALKKLSNFKSFS